MLRPPCDTVKPVQNMPVTSQYVGISGTIRSSRSSPLYVLPQEVVSSTRGTRPSRYRDDVTSASVVCRIGMTQPGNEEPPLEFIWYSLDEAASLLADLELAATTLTETEH